MVIVWRLRGNISRTALCWIAWHNVHSLQHTYMISSYRSNRLSLSHWDPYAVRRGGCLELYYCNMVEWFWWDLSLISTTNSVRPSICLSVTRVDCDKSKWCTADILLPNERAITLLLDINSGWWATLPSLRNLRSKWPTPFEKRRLQQISAYNASTVRDGEKVQLWWIWSRPRAFQRAIDGVHTCVTPKYRKGRSKAIFSFFE